MDMPGLQQLVGKWAVHNFPKGNDTECAALGLGEESGEVQRAVLKRAQQIRGTYEEWTQEIEKELGDVFIKLCHIAYLENMDLESVIMARWNTVKDRDLRKNPAGHGLPQD